MNKWYEKSGENGDIVVSTRVRLARNLKKYPFPCKLKTREKQEINKIVTDVLVNGNSAISKRFSVLDLNDLSEIELISLVERHLVSPNFISNKDSKRLLLLNDETVSIMLNEEDHIRIQVMKEGFNLDEAYDIANKIDTLLSENLLYAYNEKLGYLTQCPTNLGTGLRASTMLHLPALQMNGQINNVSSNLSKLGFTLRGSYGEGTKAVGDLYQISNQVTLGISEEDAISNLKNIAFQLISQERLARKSFSSDVTVLDKIGRSLGVLLNSYILSNEEFMNLISNVRFGVSIGKVDNIGYDTMNSLMVNVGPAMLMKNEGKKLTSLKRDEIRSKIVKQKLGKN